MKYLPSYRWVDSGEIENDGSIVHKTLELVVGGKASLIHVGDSVLLCSGDVGEEEICSEDGLENLDSFVARVEKMWEESSGAVGCCEDEDGAEAYLESRKMQMKIRARWYFKKEDMEEIGGTFLGVTRKALLSSMTPRDLILGEQTDDNEVPTLLGKCRVVRRAPDDRRELPKGSYVCRYDVHIPPKGEEGYGAIVLKPVVKPDNDDSSAKKKKRKRKELLDDEEDEEEDDRSLPRLVTASNGNDADDKQQQQQPQMNIRTEDRDCNATNTNNMTSSNKADDANDSPSSSPSSVTNTNQENNTCTTSSSSEDEELQTNIARPPHTKKEGSIHVGPKHQAVIPPQSQNPTPPSSDPPQLIWKPNMLPENKIQEYLAKASNILKLHMSRSNIVPTTTTDTSNDNNHHRTNTLFREMNLDAILTNLHTSNYKLPQALNQIKSNPSPFLTLWTNTEEECFNAGFRRYCGSLRMIHKHVSTKTHKDVVDYHYRFKIPDQFQKYQEKKKEQAKRMMESAERRLNDDQGRDWNKTGATEQRRMLARNFLIQVRDSIGNDKYLLLANFLKSYQEKECTVPVLKEQITELLKSDGELLEKFLDFLPKRFRA